MKEELEAKILRNFKRHMGKEIKGLKMFADICPDTWPDEYNIYWCEIFEEKENGQVWTIACTQKGSIKDILKVS